jgi:hypothetical protein
MTKFWLTMTKLCFASLLLLVIGVADTVAVAGAAAADNGAVYTMTNGTTTTTIPGTNGKTGNAVVVYDRAADGTLTMAGTFPTGGASIGIFATGNQHGLLLSKDGDCLWAVNSASNQISAFEVKGTSLSLTDLVGSGGQRPISLTVNEDLGVLYVLNAGGQVGPQYSDNITGFTVSEDCRLKSLAGSTRALSGSNVSPAQVEFNPTGSVVVVTEKTAESVFGMPPVKGGKIDTFTVGRDGRLGSRQSVVSPVTEPFGFEFDNRGQLLVTAADCHQPEPPFGGLPGCATTAVPPFPPDHPALLSYRLSWDGKLKLVDALGSTQAAPCWIAITNSRQPDDEHGQKDHYGPNEFAFVVNALATQAGGTPGQLPAGSVTGYRVSPDGSLTQLKPGVTPIPIAPKGVGVPVDTALSRNSRFLYVLSEGDGSIIAYKVGSDGSLTLLNTYPITAMPAIDIGGPFPNGLAAR